MSRWMGTLIACSVVLVACGPSPVPTATDAGWHVSAATPPSSGLEGYQRSNGQGGSRSGGNWGGTGSRNWGGNGGWGNDIGGGYGYGSPWGGYYGGYGDYSNPWGWPYYVPPIYVSSSVGNPFAPPPLAAGPWFSPFFGYMGYVGI